MALARHQSDGGMVETLNLVFGGEPWREIGGLSFDVRADRAVDLLRELYGARWVETLSTRMLGDNKVTRYVLAHFTNHEAGRDLMKDCMWAACPDGGFYARRSDNPNQTLLIEVEPNLGPLDDWLVQQLQAGAIRWSALSQRVRNEPGGERISQLIRKRRSEGTIVASKFTGRFSETKLTRFWFFSDKEGD